MAEDIGEGGGVPGGWGAPFVAPGWRVARARTPSDARAPPLLHLLLLRRSGGELAPRRSRTVTALPSNAKERERITGLRARGGRGGGRSAQPGPGRLGCSCRHRSGLNLPSRSRRRHRRPVPLAPPPPEPLAPAAGSRRAARRRGQPRGRRRGAGGAGAAVLGLPPLSGRSIFAQLPSVSGFISFFLIAIQIQ